MKIIVLILLLLTSNTAISRDYKKLDSDYAVNGGYDVDWEVKSGNSHLYFWVKGKSAIEIFDSLDSEVKVDECLGAPSKISGEIFCVKTEELESSFCSFGINLKTNELVQGSIC